MPGLNLTWSHQDEYVSYWMSIHGRLFNYEWARNFLGMTPLRRMCSIVCWMSDSAWTEWKNYSLPRYDFVVWLPGSTPPAASWRTMLGIELPWPPGSQEYETNTAVRKNVRRLRISKSLTCDALSDRLTNLPERARSLWSSFVYAIPASRAFGKTSWPGYAASSSNQLWTDDMSCTEQCPRLRWSGRKCHCGACHRTFTGISAFDGHRRAGVCIVPEHKGMRERDGVWGYSGTKPTHWIKKEEK